MTGRIASVAAVAACAAMAASPLSAAELPVVAPPAAVHAAGVFEADAVNAHQYAYYRRNRTSVGDVIGTVVAIGAIAAVASAVGKVGSRPRTRGGPYPESYPERDRRYEYRGDGYDARYDGGSRGLDRAVDTCAREVERNARIDTVDGALRNGTGWSVNGKLRTGEPFSCAIGADGRIETVDYGNRGASIDRQWDADRYAAARARAESAGSAVPEETTGVDVDLPPQDDFND